jgi:hypothetical protein
VEVEKREVKEEVKEEVEERAGSLISGRRILG